MVDSLWEHVWPKEVGMREYVHINAGFEL